MKIRSILLMGVLFVTNNPLQANSSDILSVQDLITPNSLACHFNFDKTDNEPILTYFSSANKTPLNHFNKAKKTLTLFAVTKIHGIKLFSKTKEKTDITIINKAHIDIDVKKYGVHVLRITDYHVKGVQISEYDADGYYLILKGLPKANIIKLEKHGVYIADKFTKIKKTKGGNTRIICNIAG